MKVKSQYRKSVQSKTINRARKFLGKSRQSPDVTEMEFNAEFRDYNRSAAS